MTNLDFYLTEDHSARFRTTLLSIAVGATAGIIAEWLGASQNISVATCVLAASAIEVMRAARYSQPIEKWHRQDVDHLPSEIRRSILALPVSALLFLVFAIFPTSRIEAAVVEDRLKRNASDPTDPENIKETKRLLAEAQAENVKIASKVVESTGEKFIRGTKANPAAWDAVLAIGDYRSFLNMDAQPKLPFPYALEIQMINRHATFPIVTASGKVPADQTAIYNQIGKNPVAGERFGPAFFIADGDEELLDGMHFRNVVFRKVQILYTGSQMVLENVYFINCQFGFLPNPNANVLGLMEQILKSPSVNFTAS